MGFNVRIGCVVKMLAQGLPLSPHCANEVPERGKGPPTSEEVALARSRLDEDYAFVGMTDRWELSICLFNAMFGTPCRRAQFEHYLYDTIMEAFGWVNSTLQGPFIDSYVDPYDGPLWEQANQIFEENLRRYNVSAETCKPC